MIAFSWEPSVGLTIEIEGRARLSFGIFIFTEFSLYEWLRLFISGHCVGAFP